ncbi:MAG: NAD(P)H-dependent oxidoreductase [Clostridia bacterium]|nr:NAD(P)H-dependent oxidoreductase [Clostridia bacterium]
MVLFVNACVREASRTRHLAGVLLQRLGDDVDELRLHEVAFPVVDEAFLRARDRLIAAKAFDDPLFAMARQFAAAERIVVAAPYWDLSFPAALKQYIEQINVLGITFVYAPEGTPKGLCRAKKLYYVTTAGGGYVPEAFGFGYIKALAQGYYGIPDVELIQATGLDLEGADAEQILAEAADGVKRKSPTCVFPY